MRLLTVVIDSKFSLADDKQLISVWHITVISDHPALSMLAVVLELFDVSSLV